MRQINHSVIIRLYFNASRFLMGEVLLIVSAGFPFILDPGIGLVFSAVFLAVGVFLIRRKIVNLKLKIHILKHGLRSRAKITRITKTDIEHNERPVLEYIFQYETPNKRLNFEYRSSRRNNLQVRQEFDLFYLEAHPKSLVIPQLYGIKIDA